MYRRDDSPLEPWEYPDEEDLADGNASADYLPCPYCGEPVYEDLVQCPHCRMFLGVDWRARPERPKWYMRFGYWGAKTLLLNWIVYGILLAGIAAIIAAIRILSE